MKSKSSNVGCIALGCSAIACIFFIILAIAILVVVHNADDNSDNIPLDNGASNITNLTAIIDSYVKLPSSTTTTIFTTSI